MPKKKFSLDGKTVKEYSSESEQEFMDELSEILRKYRDKVDRASMSVTLIDVAHDILLTEKGPYQSLIIATGILHSFSQRGIVFDMEKLN